MTQSLDRWTIMTKQLRIGLPVEPFHHPRGPRPQKKHVLRQLTPAQHAARIEQARRASNARWARQREAA